MRQAINTEQQIIDLLSQLELVVRRPSWSVQLEEIRTLLAQLVIHWDTYRRGDDCDDQRLREGARSAKSAEHRAHMRRNQTGAEKLDTGMVE
jgi:hypothetical protein